MRLACASPLAPCALILLFTFLCLAATPSARGLADLQGLGDDTGYSAWLHALSVASLEPDTVSNDGNATVHVEILGPACPPGPPGGPQPKLYLLFPGLAAVAGGALTLYHNDGGPFDDTDAILVPGELSADCRSVTFRASTSPAFQSVLPGSYPVAVSAGRGSPPLPFPARTVAAGAPTVTTTLTVVGAAVARLVGQTTSANSAHATVYVSARLDSPPLLPASLALRLSDPDAAEVVPPVLTWRPGEQATKQFALRLNKHVGVLPPGAEEGGAGAGAGVGNWNGGDGERQGSGAGNGTEGGPRGDGGSRNGTDAGLGRSGDRNETNSSSGGGGGGGGAVGAGGAGGNDTDASGGGGSRNARNSSSSSNSTSGLGGDGGVGRPGAAVLYAEAVPLNNLLLQDGSDGGQARLVVSAPLPAFYVLGNQALYRSQPGVGGLGLGVGVGSNQSIGTAGNMTASRNSSTIGSSSNNSNITSTNGSAGSGGSGSGVRGSDVGGRSTVDVPVRRASGSPFPSVLNYTAVLLQATGCPNLTTCQQAIRGSGTLTFLPADDEETASVTVVWGLVPQQALLRVGLALTPVSNAAAAPGAGPAAGVGAGPGAAAGAAGAQQGQGDGLADANATTAVYVFGTTYGTCPAGTRGPWRDPAAAQASYSTHSPPPPRPPPANSSAGPHSSDASHSLLPGAKGWCSGVAIQATALVPYLPTTEFTPVLASCEDGTTTVQSSQGYSACPAPSPTTTLPTPPSSPQPPRSNDTAPPQPRTQVPPQPRTQVPPQPPPSRRSRRRRQQEEQRGEQQQNEQHQSSELVHVVLRVPYDRELAGVFLPLRSSTETVRALGTNCDAPPAWRIVDTDPAASDSPPGGAATARANGKQGVTVISSSTSGGGGGSGGNAHRSLLPMGDAPLQAAAEGCFPDPAAAWARWTLPPVVQPCWATVAVFDRPAPAPAPAPAQSAPPPSPSPTTIPRNRFQQLPGNGSADAPRTANTTTTPAASNASTTGSSGGSRNSSSNALVPSPAQLPPAQRVRAYNITLQPLSDPAVFSHMSLMLRERSSPRTLLLCGFPAGVLRALAARRYGLVPAGLAGEHDPTTGSGDAGREGGGNAATAEQLAWVAATLAQAVRGNRDALRQLQEPAAADEAAAAAAALAPRSPGSREEKEWPGPARRSPPAPAPGGESGRRLRQRGRGEGDGEGASESTPPASPPVVQAGDLLANLTGGGVGGTLGWGTALTEHDGFEVPHEPGSGGSGQGRWLYLLYNLQYVEWCDPAGQQVVDGALLAGAQADSELVVASSDGAVLPQVYGNGTGAEGSGGPLVIGRALLAELARKEMAARGVVAAAGPGPEQEPAGGRAQGSRLEEAGGGVVAGSAVSLLRQEQLEAFNTSTSSSIDSKNGTSSGEPEQVRHAVGAAGDERRPAPPAPAPPQPAPPTRSGNGSGSAGSGCTGGSRVGYGEGGQLPTPDQQLVTTLLAPDGVTTARVRLDLYNDYRATVAAALLAAAECAVAAPAPLANSSRSVNGTKSNSSTTNSTAPARDDRAAVPEPAARRPTPQPAAAGNASSGNASATWLGTAARAPGSGWVLAGRPPPWSPLDACGACGPGSYSEEANATACLMCPPGSASSDVVNTACAQCGAGTYAFQWGSPACRRCPAGTFSARPGAMSCSVCSDGTTTLAPGAAACSVPPARPEPDGGGLLYALVLYFRMMLNVGQGFRLQSLRVNTTGIDAPTGDDIVKVLIAADTSEMLRIPTTQVHVGRLQEVNPSTFLVNVSATVPLGMAPGGGGGGSGGGGGEGAAGSPEDLDADDIIGRLVGNPDGSFPRTKEATGGSVQVEIVEQQVVAEGGGGGRGASRLHVVLWPTLGGSLLLATAVGLGCWAWARRRRRRAGERLPPLTDAFKRVVPGLRRLLRSVPPVYIVYGELPGPGSSAFEMQDMALPAPLAAARHRIRGSKHSLASLAGAHGTASLGLGLEAGTAGAGPGPSGSGSGAPSHATPETQLYTMYYREAMAAPRI